MKNFRKFCAAHTSAVNAWLARWPLRVLMLAAFIGPASATPTNTAQASSSGSGFCQSEGGGSSAGPISAKIVCGDNTGSGAAIAFAAVGHVGGTARTTEGSLCCSTGADADASYRDLVVFSGPAAGLIPVSINLAFAGFVNSTQESSAAVRARAAIGGVLAGSLVAGSHNGIFDVCNSTFFGLVCGPQFTLGAIQSAIVLVAPNLPIDIFLELEAGSGSFGVGTSASAEFSNSLDFATGSPLFNLPAGYTANSASSFIFDNRFVPPPSAIPEPNVAALCVLGLIAVGAVTRRRALRAAASAAPLSV